MRRHSSQGADLAAVGCEAGAARATLIMQGLAEHSQGQTRPHGCVRLGAGVDAAAAAAATGLRVPKNRRSLGNSGDCALPTSATATLPPRMGYVCAACGVQRTFNPL